MSFLIGDKVVTTQGELCFVLTNAYRLKGDSKERVVIEMERGEYATSAYVDKLTPAPQPEDTPTAKPRWEPVQ